MNLTRPIKIGGLTLETNLLLAPMVRTSDVSLRLLARGQGAGLVSTEALSAHGIVRGALLAQAAARCIPEERPVAIQLFGSDPGLMAEAAAIMEERGADLIDVNLGCPARNFVQNEAGSYLLREPRRVGRILGRMRAVMRRIPLTVKMRAGWDADSITAPRIAEIAEDAGVDAVTVHPRTRVQEFRGSADWSLIREIKRRLRIPVVGNGDVTSPARARDLFRETGCDAVMIGRAALGNPWIFSRTLAYLRDGTPQSVPSVEVIGETAVRHIALMRRHHGDRFAAKTIRRHLACYTRGLRGATRFRTNLSALHDIDAIEEAARAFFAETQIEKGYAQQAAA